MEVEQEREVLAAVVAKQLWRARLSVTWLVSPTPVCSVWTTLLLPNGLCTCSAHTHAPCRVNLRYFCGEVWSAVCGQYFTWSSTKENGNVYITSLCFQLNCDVLLTRWAWTTSLPGVAESVFYELRPVLVQKGVDDVCQQWGCILHFKRLNNRKSLTAFLCICVSIFNDGLTLL